ncbi:MAG TPA: GGDEF domain-containing protein [Acidimicrobiales bacterium]|nr:GGDEF domain-containing protein [Acidimicrobiales bacterium]
MVAQPDVVVGAPDPVAPLGHLPPPSADADTGPGGSRLLGWTAGAYCAAFLLWVILRAGTPETRELLSDIAPLPLGLAAWAAAWRASGRNGGDERTKRGWQRIGAAFFLWWLGDAVWFAQEVILQRPPFPSPADLGYLASYPVLAWGLLTLPGAPRRCAEWVRVALDAVTVLLAAAMVVWYLVVGPSIRSAPGAVATVLDVAYPVGDLLLLFAVTVVLLGRQRQERTLWLLLAGTGALVIADVAYARLSLSDSYVGGDWPDAFWMIAELLFVVGATSHRHRVHRARAPRRLGQTGVSNLPYAAIVLGYGLLFAVGRSQATYPLNGLLVGAGAITVVVMARQIRVTVENSRLLGQLHYLAEVDGLTSILNRRSFFEAGEHVIEWAAESSRPVTVLMIDIDHFKRVNDTFGHAVGDKVLVTVASITKAQLRDTDVVGRYGGDELAVVIPDCAVSGGLEVAERIRQAVGACPIVTADGSVRATLSVGVAEAGRAKDLSTALARADTALYQAKEAGRGCTRAVS